MICRCLYIQHMHMSRALCINGKYSRLPKPTQNYRRRARRSLTLRKSEGNRRNPAPLLLMTSAMFQCVIATIRRRFANVTSKSGAGYPCSPKSLLVAIIHQAHCARCRQGQMLAALCFLYSIVAVRKPLKETLILEVDDDRIRFEETLFIYFLDYFFRRKRSMLF